MGLFDEMAAALNAPCTIPPLPPGLGDLLGQALSQETRLLGLHPSADSGLDDESFVVHRLTGWEQVNLGFRYEVQVLSADAYLPLKTPQGIPISISILTSSGDSRAINGVVTAVHSEGSDGSLAAYRLVIEPVTAALDLGRCSRTFQRLTDLDVVLQLIQEQRDHNPVFTACLNVDNRCRATFPVREFIYMCDETPWAFIRRRLAKIGVSFAFAPTAGSAPGYPQHDFLLFTDPLDLDDNPVGAARFHRLAGSASEDAIAVWNARRRLGCATVARRRWDHASGSLDSTTEVPADQGRFGNALASTLVDYVFEAPLEHDDADGQDRTIATRAQAKGLLIKDFAGAGNVRDFAVATLFELRDHPVHDRDSLQDRTFALTRLALQAENNLPAALQEALPRLGLPLGDPLPATGLAYANRFECQRATIALVPEEIAPPNPGPQTATVVGPPDSTVHTDALGRVRCQFHSARPEDHPGLGASGSADDSHWIRPIHLWGGDGMGGSFPFRTGDEVLLDFLNNDPDKPVIVGCLPGAMRPPARFSGVSGLPADRAMAGLRSQEHGGTRGNQLCFDDSPGEIKTHLGSDHAGSSRHG